MNKYGIEAAKQEQRRLEEVAMRDNIRRLQRESDRINAELVRAQLKYKNWVMK